MFVSLFFGCRQNSPASPPADTPTATSTNTPDWTHTNTPTFTETPTFSGTVSRTYTPTFTPTRTPTPTVTMTQTPQWGALGYMGYAGGPHSAFDMHVVSSMQAYASFANGGLSDAPCVYYADDDNWNFVYGATATSGTASTTNVYVNGSNVYLLYYDNYNYSVMSLRSVGGGAWQAYGNPEDALGDSAAMPALAGEGSTLYAVTRGSSPPYALSAALYTGTGSWNAIGSAEFNGVQAAEHVAAVSGGTLYVFVYENSVGNVWRYSSGWSKICHATNGVNNGEITNSLSMCIYAGTPYIAFRDQSATESSRMTVMQYGGGTTWNTLGSQGFNSSAVDRTGIAVDSSGIYAACRNAPADTVSVFKFNGSSWDELPALPGSPTCDDMRLQIVNGVLYLGMDRQVTNSVDIFEFK